MASKHVKKYSDFIQNGTMQVGINGNLFQMEICSNHGKGLIGRGIKYDGIIFKFDLPQPLVFHTIGCIIPIDIVFIMNNEIVKIYNSCEPGMQSITCEEADTVLEFHSGTCKKLGIEVGTFCSI